jgi:hypothetical protein
VWISFTKELEGDERISELGEFLKDNGLKYIFTFSGVCFYDDKHQDPEATNRLRESLKGVPRIEDDYVYMTIQPSDDCYHKGAVESIQLVLRSDLYDAVGFKKGYICNYSTKEVSDYNPTTNPPFYTLKFKREDFVNPDKHLEYTAIKRDAGKYKAGTPLPSHEYVEDVFLGRYMQIDKRGFLVGTHSENISTFYNHPFKGEKVGSEVLDNFGLKEVECVKLKWSLRKIIMRHLPFKYQRKLRYWLGERCWHKIYEFLRS